MESLQADRQMEYDWLRCISCFSVVIIHTSAMYVKDDFVGLVRRADYMLASFWRMLTVLAVPSFVMLSGAFVIKKSGNFSSAVDKTFKRIIIPTLIFSVIYVLMHYTEIFFSSILGIKISTEKTNLWIPLLDWLKGKPNVTMWYMYMIIPLYLVTPVIHMIKLSLSNRVYRWLAVAMMVYGVFIAHSCSLSWILQFITWIGYFMLGDIIRQWGQEIRGTTKKYHYRQIGMVLIVTAYLLLIVYWYVIIDKSEIIVPGSFSMVVIIATIMQFIGFSMIQIKKLPCFIRAVAKYSLYIYLIHPIFCEICMQIFGRILKWIPSALGIPAYSLLIVGASLGTAKIICRFCCHESH